MGEEINNANGVNEEKSEKVVVAKKKRMRKRLVPIRQQQIYEMMAQGKTNAEIAAALQMSPRAVTYHTNELFRKAAQGRQEHLLELLLVQRQELEQIKVRAKESFEASCKVVSEKIEGDFKYVALSKNATVSGNWQFLEIQMKAIDRIARLYGLDKPIKLALTDSQGNDIKTPDEVWQKILKAAGAEGQTKTNDAAGTVSGEGESD